MDYRFTLPATHALIYVCSLVKNTKNEFKYLRFISSGRLESARACPSSSGTSHVYSVVVVVCSANAHPSMADSSGLIPLHYSVDRGHIECVKLILNYPNTALGLTGLRPALDMARENDFSEISHLLDKARERCVALH